MVRLGLEPDGRVTPRVGKRLSGRGASLHPSQECVREAVRTGSFARAFRRRVEGVEVALLWEQMTTVRTKP
jgi:predicted RNA-binding protein YlxR (DUF448 family)